METFTGTERRLEGERFEGERKHLEWWVVGRVGKEKRKSVKERLFRG